MPPEEAARKRIDQQLEQAGWSVQNYRELNISASLGVAVREFPLTTVHAAGNDLLVAEKSTNLASKRKRRKE